MAIIILTGPTCAGKSTVEAELNRAGVGRAISHTTRAPRANETSGVHYHFVSDFEFDRLSASGAFIEQVGFGSARYAMSGDALCLAQFESRHVAIVVEPEGAAQIRAFCRQMGMPFVSAWIDCGREEQARRWVKRLVGDMVVGKEVIGAYAERMALMLGVEQGWIAQASFDRDAAGEQLYDLQLDSLTYSPEALARRLLEAADHTKQR